LVSNDFISFGTNPDVYRATNRRTNKECVVKVFRTTKMEKKEID